MNRATRYPSASYLLLALTACSISFSACKKKGTDNTANNNNNNNNQPPTTQTSQICANITGTEAVYWDLMNGIPRTDIPGGLPQIKQVGGSYSHPSFPLLGFIYPPGYTPNTDNTSSAVGVNLIRNDNRSIWRYTSLFVSGSFAPDDVVANEINTLLAFFGNGAIEVVCSQKGTQPRASGITSSFSSRFIRFNGFTATVNVTITTQAGLGAEQINIVTTAAPTNEFTNEILNTYLPIDYQLLYKDNGEVDSDGDGFSDSVDNAPFDNTKH